MAERSDDAANSVPGGGRDGGDVSCGHGAAAMAAGWTATETTAVTATGGGVAVAVTGGPKRQRGTAACARHGNVVRHDIIE